MSRFSKSIGGDFELPEEDTYVFVLTGIADTFTHPPKKPGEQPSTSIQFQFQIADDESDWDGVEVRDWFPEKFTDRNKTGELFAAILGTKETPDDLDLPDLQNKPFKASLKHSVSPKDGKTYPKLTSPIAIRPKGTGRRRGLAETVDTPVDDEPPF